MSDLDLLIAAAREAGEIASDYHRGDALDVQYKPDEAGPVTRADLAVNAHLETILRGARPDYGWLSEESPDDRRRLKSARCFVIDPIDGTRSFIEGSDTWAHSLAVVEAGKPVAAVVYLPRRDLLYAAASGRGATLNGAPVTVRGAALDGAEILANRPTLDAVHWTEVPRVKRAYRPSLAYRLCLVAEGRYPAMVTFRASWEWDLAAGVLIAAEAGATVTDRAGRPLRFNTPSHCTDGALVAEPSVHAALLARSAYAGADTDDTASA